jgi:hypothetical protein
MTVPVTAPVVKKPAYVLVPLLAGAVVAVALGVYGKVHKPTFHAIYTGPFETMFGMKVWLATAAMGFALVQLVTALWMYGKLGIRAPEWLGGLHRATGTIAFLISLPVAFHCLWALGFQTSDTRVLLHSLAGCVFYGAFVAKVLTLHSKRVPGWALPWVGGLLFTALVGAGLTSAVWYFAKVGVPS